MFQNFIRSNGLLRQIVDTQYRQYKHEDISYISAFLSRLRNQNQNIDNIYQELNVLEPNEHWEIAKGDHLEQIFVLHQNTRQQDLLINKRFENLSKMTDIIDPDKFPIFSLIDKLSYDEIVSLWEYKPSIMENVEKVNFNVGTRFYFIRKTIKFRPSWYFEQIESGQGIFLQARQKQKVKIGSLLGFVPGIIYNSFEKNEVIQKMSTLDEIKYLKRYDEFVIDFSQQLFYPYTLGYSQVDMINMLNNEKGEIPYKRVNPEVINPFAKGHKINHPPPDTPANVILLDLIIPNHFFPQDYMRFLPYMKYAHDNDTQLKEYYHNECFRGVGVFALRDIYDGEELYADYFYSKLYDIDKPVPDWLVKPPPIEPYFTKYNYETKFSLVAQLIDHYLANQDLQKYINFDKKTSHDPIQQEQDNIIQNTINKNK